MKKLFLLFFCLLSLAGISQQPVHLFMTCPMDDSAKNIIGILEKELNKVSAIEFRLQTAGAANNTGITLSVLTRCTSTKEKLIAGGSADAFLLTGNGRQVVIKANYFLGLYNGVFSYLRHLGFRYYFPNPDWHVYPVSLNLYPIINVEGKPSFDHRRLWYGYGTGSKKADADYNFWFMANRLGGSLDLSFGHAYDDIVYRNKEIFAKHPEWFYPKQKIGVVPDDPKFDLANESLIRFIIDDVFKRLEEARIRKKPIKMISMSPSDGLGTCNTPACQKLGSITDRVYYLMNRVAKAVRQKYPGTWIGGMAYSEYCPPPAIKLEPNIYVNIATAFNYSVYTTEQLIEQWSKKAGKVGVYDYLGLYAWDYDMPGQSRASRVESIASILRNYYKQGTRAYEAETNIGISKALGHYVISQMLWDIKADEKKLKEEFYSRSFGNVASGVKALWEEWEDYGFSKVRESDVARWIDKVTELEKKVTDQKIKNRFFHIKGYLSYMVLYRKYYIGRKENDLIELLTFSNQMLDHGSFAGYPSLWDLGNASPLPGFKFDDPQAKYRKNNQKILPSGLDYYLASERRHMKIIEGLTRFPLSKGFKAAPGADKWKGAAGDGSQDQNSLWMTTDFAVKITGQSKENYIDISGGFVTGGGGNQPIRISVYPYRADRKTDGKPLVYYEYKGSKTNERVSLATLKPGHYLLRVDDPAKIFRIRFARALYYSLLISPVRQLQGNYANHLFIYVPPGVRKFNVLKYEAKFITPAGRIVDLTDRTQTDVEVNVQPGEQGIWKLIFFSGELYFDGIPPVMGVVADRMLIPDNVE
ncbi:MAG: DUF4838 domain-containing protein [Chitinophagaceae bacterium]|nr:DUF4838 domain-containing protein [Chitinophagaceae bacterium]